MKSIISVLLILLLSEMQVWAQGKPVALNELASYHKPDREKVLFEGAKKEGKLMWYTSLTGGPNQQVPKAFEAKYPGVKVDVYRGSSDDLAARIVQEAQAKRFIVDSIETTFPVLKLMQEYKFLEPYLSSYLGQYPDETKEKANKGLVYWATDRESYIGLAYNTNVVAAGAVPKRFDDLLKPELKGKIGFATSDTGNRVIGAMLAVKGPQYLAKLKSQDVTLHAVSGRAILDMLFPGSWGCHRPFF